MCCGVPGVPGVPGLNGRDGARGEKGYVGAPGKKGPGLGKGVYNRFITRSLASFFSFRCLSL